MPGKVITHTNIMPSYDYKNGFKPYKRDFNGLGLRAKQILILLEEEKGRGRLNRIARRVGVSRCFVWQVAHRLEATQSMKIAEIKSQGAEFASQPIPVPSFDLDSRII